MKNIWEKFLLLSLLLMLLLAPFAGLAPLMLLLLGLAVYWFFSSIVHSLVADKDES